MLIRLIRKFILPRLNVDSVKIGNESYVTIIMKIFKTTYLNLFDI